MLARVALLAVSLLSFVRAQDLPPCDLPADVAARVTALTHELPFDLLAVLGDRDPAVREKRHDAWEELSPRERCALVRAGLRQGGAVAIGAAALARGDWLDLAETKAAVRASLPVLNLIDTPFDVGEIFHWMDGSDAAAFLTNPGPMPREIPQFLGAMHRSLGPEHFAQVEQLARGDDLLLRQEAAKYIGVLPTAHERIAAYLLAAPAKDEAPAGVDVMTTRVPFVPREVHLRPAGPGYPPLFAAFVTDVFLEHPEGRLWPALLAWQWQQELTPAEVDRDLLIRLAACDDDNARRIAIAGLARLGGDGVGAVLQRIAKGESDERTVAPWFACAELARLGDAAARARLADPEAEPLALALLWQLVRAEAEPQLQAAFVAATDDEAVGARANAFGRLLAAAEAGDGRGVPMQGLGAALAERALVVPLPAPLLFELLSELPEARTPALLQQGLAAVTAETVAVAPLAVLELGGAEALAARLRAILADAADHSDALRAALPALLRLDAPLLGDDAFALRLLDHIEATWSGEDCEELRIRLAAARGPAVRARILRGLAVDAQPGSWPAVGALAAAAAATGVDVRIALRLLAMLGGSNSDRIEFAAASAAMLDPLTRGDGPGAILAWLDHEPYDLHHLDGLWTLPEGKGMALLAKARDRRETGQYRLALGQLARGGDRQAKAEVERAIGARLYGWIDDFDEHVLTDGQSLDRVPLLLSQFDSNCCTHAVLGSALEGTIECNLATGDDIAATVFERERLRYATPRARLRWSRIAEQWLLVP